MARPQNTTIGAARRPKRLRRPAPARMALAFLAAAALTPSKAVLAESAGDGSASPASVVDAPSAAIASRSASSADAAGELKKVGEARLRVLLWSIYDSRLYTPDGDYREGIRPLRLEIEYLRSVKASALVERTRQEWDAMGRSHPRQEDWLARLDRLWPDIQAKDVLALQIAEDNVATFLHNGRIIGRIDDPAFGQQFIDIWLSPDSTRPELRQALLGDINAD